MAPEEAGDPGFRNRDAVIALEIPHDADGAEVIRAAEMKDRLDDVGGCAEPWGVRARLLVDQALITMGLIRFLPDVDP